MVAKSRYFGRMKITSLYQVIEKSILIRWRLWVLKCLDQDQIEYYQSDFISNIFEDILVYYISFYWIIYLEKKVRSK